MKKPFALFVFVSAAAAAFSLFACLGGDDKGGGGGGNAGGIEIISLDETNRVIITREIDYWCDSSNVQSDTTIDTMAYVIAGGKLYTWDPNADFAGGADTACYADVATGSSTSIIGTWTFAGAREAIPAANRPAACPNPLPPDSSESDFAGTATVSATKIDVSFTGGFCFGQEMFEDYPSDISVVSIACNSVQLRNDSTLQTATFSNTMSGNTLTFTFQSGTATCTATQSISPPGVVPTCPQTGGMDTTFFNCMMGSGFFGTGQPGPLPLPKLGLF